MVTRAKSNNELGKRKMYAALLVRVEYMVDYNTCVWDKN